MGVGLADGAGVLAALKSITIGWMSVPAGRHEKARSASRRKAHFFEIFISAFLSSLQIVSPDLSLPRGEA